MTAKNTKRLDALVALPLDRFRTAIARLSPDELAALEARIELLMVKTRWMRGSHGLERHRAPLELALLDRRWIATRRERDRGRDAVTQLRLVESAPSVRELVVPLADERAA
jgi:hypothetical protein